MLFGAKPILCLWFFGAHLGISKIRACLVLAIMRFFLFFVCLGMLGLIMHLLKLILLGQLL